MSTDPRRQSKARKSHEIIERAEVLDAYYHELNGDAEFRAELLTLYQNLRLVGVFHSGGDWEHLEPQTGYIRAGIAPVEPQEGYGPPTLSGGGWELTTAQRRAIAAFTARWCLSRETGVDDVARALIAGDGHYEPQLGMHGFNLPAPQRNAQYAADIGLESRTAAIARMDAARGVVDEERRLHGWHARPAALNAERVAHRLYRRSRGWTAMQIATEESKSTGFLVTSAAVRTSLAWWAKRLGIVLPRLVGGRPQKGV